MFFPVKVPKKKMISFWWSPNFRQWRRSLRMMAAIRPTVRIMATSMEASRRTARTAIHRGKPTDHGWETKEFGKWPLKSGKVKFFLKTMGLLPSVLLFWKCWKDQWKEGGWPSKLVVKINQKCEVDHPKCTWNQKKCRLSSFWVLTIKHDQFTIKMWVVLSKNWEGMGVKSNDFPQVWTSIRTMWILPGYRRVWSMVLYCIIGSIGSIGSGDDVLIGKTTYGSPWLLPRIGLAYKSTNHHVQHQNYFLGVYPIFRHRRIAVKQYVRFRSSQWRWRKAPQSPLTGFLIFLDTLV